MAEAIINKLFGEHWQAYSAGTKPAGYVHPKTIEVLREIGIEHHGESKSVNKVRDIDFDLVITACDSVAEDCPLWLGRGNKAHHSFPDPAETTGSEEEILTTFRSVRDSIIKIIPEILAEYQMSTA